MTYTSINHCARSNFQIDHATVDSFEAWCVKNDVIWAHLFLQNSGLHVGEFNNVEGYKPTDSKPVEGE